MWTNPERQKKCDDDVTVRIKMGGSPLGERHSVINPEIVHKFAWIGNESLAGDVRRIVLRFPGVGGSRRKPIWPELPISLLAT
jgi:hypothetical protein